MKHGVSSLQIHKLQHQPDLVVAGLHAAAPELLPPALEVGGDDAAHIEHRRHQVMRQRELVIGLVLAVRVHDHAQPLLLGHLEAVNVCHGNLRMVIGMAAGLR